MALVTEEAYPSGVPLSTVVGWAPSGCAWHWSAGSGGRAGWEGTVRYLISTRLTINASYHAGMWCEHDATHRACRTVIQWIVPATKAAHSIAPSQVFKYNPNKPRAIQDTRFREVRRILGAKASDPNAGCLAMAYAGMPADLERDMACPVFRADVQSLARQLVARPTVIDRPHFGHGWIQPINRYEMDIQTDFIALLYAATPAQEEDMAIEHLKNLEPFTTVQLRAGTSFRSSPAFNPRAYDENLVGRRAYVTTVPAFGWVEGTNVTLDSGAVEHAGKRWMPVLLSQSGILFVHEGDVVSVKSAEELGGVGSTEAQLQRALDAANTRTANVKTKASTSIRLLAGAATDLATGARAAADAIDKL